MESANNTVEKVDPYNELYYAGSILSEALDDIKSFYEEANMPGITIFHKNKIESLFHLNERWKVIAQKIAHAEAHRSYMR